MWLFCLFASSVYGAGLILVFEFCSVAFEQLFVLFVPVHGHGHSDSPGFASAAKVCTSSPYKCRNIALTELRRMFQASE